MKARESGMPEVEVWESFFDPATILDRLQFDDSARLLVEYGCGYGTFTIPAARRCAGVVQTYDIDPVMAAMTQQRAEAAGLNNVRAEVRDFVAYGIPLDDGAADYAMLFNLLHLEGPVPLLCEAFRILRPGGLLGVIHWNYDPQTPRGPSMAIRPRPEQCRAWAVESGFGVHAERIDLPPYHYGFIFERPRTS